MQNLIERYGLERTLLSIFPYLKGIIFKDVIYDKPLNDNNPIIYLTQNIDDNWYFGQGNMAMIFRSVKSTEKTKILETLLNTNNLKVAEVFNNGVNSNIKFWKGNGFKIEDAEIKGQSILIITNEESFSDDNLAMRDTKLASVIESPKWVRGIDRVFDGNSITSENKNFSNFTNTPLFFNDNKSEYIIIPVSTYGIGKRIIDRVISDNGGDDNFEFKESEKTKEWEYFHEGKIFTIGYLPQQSCIRINGIPQAQQALDGTKLERGIHPLSDKINGLIKGLNSPVYNPAEGGVPDGRFYAISEKANVIVSFFIDLNSAKDKFDEIVLNHNPNDKTLKIKNKSIKEFLDENSEELIEFNVGGKFQMQLSKGNDYYRINLYPADGLINDWNFDKTKEDLNLIPESSASKRIIISEETSSKINTNSEAKIENERKFLEQSTEGKNKNKAKTNNFLKRKNILSWRKKINFPYLKKFLKFLILFLMFLFIYKACFFDECSNNAVCYYLKAQKAEKNTEYDKAFGFYKKAIRVDRKYIDAFNSRGLLHQKLEKHDKAIRDFSKIIDIDATNWLAFHNRANSYTAQGDKKYSIKFKKAMKDYDKSIDLNSSNENGVSFFNRGLLKEKIEVEACDDFVYSCDRSYSEGCDKYNKSCYPENGEFVLFNEFGRGVFANNGLGKISHNNSRGKKDLVVVVRRFLGRKRDGPRIRAQFIRKGETIIMDNIPNGTYYIQTYNGDSWIKNLNPKNRFLRSSSLTDYKSFPFRVYNNTSRWSYSVPDGNQGDPINKDDFFN